MVRQVRDPRSNHLVAVSGLGKENVSRIVGQLDAVRRYRLSNSIWAYEGASDKVETGIQVFLCRQIMSESSTCLYHKGG